LDPPQPPFKRGEKTKGGGEDKRGGRRQKGGEKTKGGGEDKRGGEKTKGGRRKKGGEEKVLCPPY